MIIIGDTHGIRPIFELIDKYQIHDQNLIHVGDFGLGFLPIEKDLINLSLVEEMLLETNNTLYVIRGNHDNPIFWDKSSGLNLRKYHNLELVEDYSVRNIEEKNVLFIGGAISIDRSNRKEDKPFPTWWKNEKFNLQRTKLEEIFINHKNIDMVITHTAPGFCFPNLKSGNKLLNDWIRIEQAEGSDLKKELIKEAADVTTLYDILTTQCKYNIKDWFYGHFHKSRTETIGNTTFHLLGINEIKEVRQSSNQIA